LKVPIFEGTLIEHAIGRVDVGGKDITHSLQRLLTESNYYLNSTSEMQILRELKEKLSYIALDFDQEISGMKSSQILSKSYELPDGNLIYGGSALFRAPEAIFRPSLIGRELCGVHELCYNSAIRCGVDLEKEMFSNVILSGGNTLIPGFANRFRKELLILLSELNGSSLGITAGPKRK
jgi:actin, other eukaryote